MNKIAIIGAGLSGLMCAINLARRGYRVQIFEKRSHQEICSPRYNLNGKSGRSMSMDLSERGLFALEQVGLLHAVRQNAVSMINKIFHLGDGELITIPYGRNNNEYILTISRTELYQILLNECSNYHRIELFFAHELINIDSKNKNVYFSSSSQQKIISCDFVIGSDGINSKVRSFIETVNEKKFSRTNFSHSYKELSIPSGSKLEIEAMHIWPRNQFMLVAQPNYDRSFTCALILKESSSESFNYFSEYKNIESFFDRHFPDAVKIMPNLKNEYDANPVGSLTIIHGSSWVADDFMMVIGDAAHSMVPFFGQGVNCCFEDCTVLMNLLAHYSDNWSKALHMFNQTRVAEANAISHMSSINYPELLEQPNIETIMREKQMELFLSRNFSNVYRSYHNLVCFDRISYTKIEKIRELQKKLLHQLCNRYASPEEINPHELSETIDRYHLDISSCSIGA